MNLAILQVNRSNIMETFKVLGKIDLSILDKPAVTKSPSFDFDWSEFDAIIDAQIEEASTIGTDPDDDFQTELESEDYWDSLHDDTSFLGEFAHQITNPQ